MSGSVFGSHVNVNVPAAAASLHRETHITIVAINPRRSRSAAHTRAVIGPPVQRCRELVDKSACPPERVNARGLPTAGQQARDRNRPDFSRFQLTGIAV